MVGLKVILREWNNELIDHPEYVSFCDITFLSQFHFVDLGIPRVRS